MGPKPRQSQSRVFLQRRNVLAGHPRTMFRLDLLLLSILVLSPPVLSDVVLSKVDRRVDLTSHIVRITSTLKVENVGKEPVSEVIVVFPDRQAKHLAYLTAAANARKGKVKGPTTSLPVSKVNAEGMPPSLEAYSMSLPEALGKGESFTVDVFAAFTHLLKPFPEKISQAEIQLLLFENSAYYLSPYAVQAQSLTIKLPDARVESYTRLENSKYQASEIKYGPYENLSPFSYMPIIVHFESNHPFAVAKELVREIEISHWGNVQVTDNYDMVHDGSEIKGEFSRLDFQARPHLRGASAIKNLIASLPPRAHSVYYRDEIGNISTSRLWGDLKKTELIIEPRYPMFGGWRTAFTIGYGLPLQDFLFESEGKWFINISFGSPINEIVVDTLIVKVVLPEGSQFTSVYAPFPISQWQETKFSHLDVVGRPVIVLQMTNVVPEHNQFFQVYYKFSSISMLREPMMLISGFFLFFVACIIYTHLDMSISKSSPSYLAKLQWEEVLSTIQQIEKLINKCLVVHHRLEGSLRDLSRTGDVQACKAARKSADSTLKELSKEVRPLLSFLQSSPQAGHIVPKVEELVAKERELQDKMMAKHSTVVDCYEKKVAGREVENRIASQQQKIASLRQEVDDLLEFINEF